MNNNVLSLTGSLLEDPANPPPPPVPTIQARPPSPSPSPEPARPAKQPRTNRPAQPSVPTETYEHEPQAVDVIDDRFLNARELKKKRKDEEKKKRDARKARKEANVLEVVESAAAGDLVGVQGEDEALGGSAGMKRKVKDEEEEAEKKRRRLDQ